MEKRKDRISVRILLCLFAFGSVGMALITNTQGLFYATVSEALGITRSALSLYYSIQSLACMITLFFAGNIISKYKNRLNIIIFIMVLMQSAGYLLFSRANSLATFIIVGVFLGIGSAFSTHLLVGILVNNWFRKRNGFVLGLFSALASATGAVLFPKLAVLVAADWRNAYFVLAMLILGLFPFAIILKYSPDMVGLKPYGADDSAVIQLATVPVDSSGVPHKVAVKSFAFWLCILMEFCCIGWSCFSGIIPGFVGSLGYDPYVIGTMASTYLIGAIIGKLLGGWLNDKLGLVRGLLVVVICGIAGPIIWSLFAATSSTILYFGGIFYGIGMGAAGVFPPVLVRECFGNMDYAKIWSNVSTAIWVASMIIIPVYNLSYDVTGSYIPGLFLAIAVFILGFIFTVLALKTSKKLERVDA